MHAQCIANRNYHFTVMKNCTTLNSAQPGLIKQSTTTYPDLFAGSHLFTVHKNLWVHVTL